MPHPPIRKRRGAVFAALSLGVLAASAGAVLLAPRRTADVIAGLSSAWNGMWPAAYSAGKRPDSIVAAETSSRISPRVVASVPGPPPAQGTFAYGDRLKITFFESLSVALGDAAAPPIAAIFPRTDLSAEYVVDEAGGIDLPKLGRFGASGQTLGSFEAQLAAAFQGMFGRTSDVHVAILERQPVYVLGGPRGGATVRHAPGMIALQAIAEAGGFDRNATDTSRAIETIRETERLGQVEDRLVRLLVRHAMLLAQRDGRDLVTLPPATVARIAHASPGQEADPLIAEANVTLGITRHNLGEQRALSERLVGIARGELAAQNFRVTQLRNLAERKAARVRDLEAIAAHGSVSQFRVADAGVDLADIAARQEDLRVAIAQAESRVAEAELARARVEQANTAEIDRSLVSASQEIDDLDRSAASMRAVVAVLRGLEGGNELRHRDKGTVLRITRRGPSGTQVLAASETTALLPGDVLEINPAEPPRPAPGAAASR